MSEVSYEPTGYSSDDLSGILSRYRRHIPLVVGATLISVVAAYGVTKLMKPAYTADAYVQFQPSQALVGTPTSTSQNAQITPDQVIDTQAEILRSPSLAKLVTDKMKLDQDPEFNSALEDKKAAKPADPETIFRKVGGNLDASRVGLTSVFKVSYTSRDPAKAAAIANAFAQSYIQQGLERKRTALAGGGTLVSSQVAELRREADAADAAVQNYKVAHGLVSAGGFTIAEQEVSQLNQQLAGAKAEEAEAVARLAAARRQAASGSGGQDVGAALDSPTIAQLRQQRAAASRTVASLSSRYGDRYPEVIQARQSLVDIDNQIQGEVSRILSNLEAQAQIQRDRRSSIETSVGGARGSLSAGASATVGLADLQRTADAVKAQYEAVLNKANMTDSQQSLVQADAQITSPATPPLAPSSPNTMMNLLLGLVFGLSLGVGAAFLRHQWVAGLDTLDDVERQLGHRFFGSLPTVKSSIKKPGTKAPVDQIVAHPLSSFAESFRNLAASALYSSDGAPIQVIGVTSALPQEGKTTSSVCLGRALAMGQSRVVMVDCDLRRRSLTETLRLTPELGLVDVLEDVSKLDRALVLDEPSGAYVLPLMPGSEQALNPFSGDGMDLVIAALRTRFDVIIMDTAPVLAVVDTRMLAPKVDSLIMLVRWRATPAKAARAALKMLETTGAKVNGVALSLVNLKEQAQSRYGDASSYYYKTQDYHTA